MGANTTQDMNESMAGLSDVSMSDVIKVNANNDSMADYSMASLNDDSMAGVDDSGYKPTNLLAQSQKSRSYVELETGGNILDGLKKEFESQANPQADEVNTKRMHLQKNYGTAEVFDENDEYDSEEEEGSDGKTRRRSFRKSQRLSLPGRSPKLADLAKKSVKYGVEDAIAERTATQESNESPESTQHSRQADGITPTAFGNHANKFALRPKLNEGIDEVSSSSDDDEDRAIDDNNSSSDDDASAAAMGEPLDSAEEAKDATVV